MRKALLLAHYFPPIAASGSMRPAGFCSYLERYGYEPLVLTSRVGDLHPVAKSDDSLLELLPERTNVMRIPYRNRQKELLALRESFRTTKIVPSRKVDESSGAEIKPAKVEASPSLKQKFLYRVFRFPDQQKKWGRACVRWAKNLEGSERPDIVYATGGPWSALLAGLDIANLHGIPLVADFRDPWTRSPRAPFSPGFGRRAKELEAKVIFGASRVIANTNELAEQFIADYPARTDYVTTITNGYHESLLDRFSSASSTDDSNTIEICHFGSIYRDRQPTQLLKALDTLAERNVAGLSRLKVRFAGPWGVSDPECERLANKLESRGLLERSGSIEHKLYLAELKKASFLLVLQGGFPLQVPAKIYEYLASGTPMILLGETGATANLVRQNKLGVVRENTVDSLIEMLEQIMSGELVHTTTAPETLKKFGYAHLTEKLCREFDIAIERHSTQNQ